MWFAIIFSWSLRSCDTFFWSSLPVPTYYRFRVFACSRFFSKSIKDRFFKLSVMVDSLHLQCPMHITGILTSAVTPVVTGRNKKALIFQLYFEIGWIRYGFSDILKTVECMDWYDILFFDFLIITVIEYLFFFYSFYLIIKEEMYKNERWNVSYLVHIVCERSKHCWCRLL